MGKTYSVKAGSGDKVYRAEGLNIVEDKIAGVSVSDTLEGGTPRIVTTYMLESNTEKSYTENDFYMSPDEILNVIQKKVSDLKTPAPPSVAETKKP